MRVYYSLDMNHVFICELEGDTLKIITVLTRQMFHHQIFNVSAHAHSDFMKNMVQQ